MCGSILHLSKTVSETQLTSMTVHRDHTTLTNVLSYYLNWA